MKLEGISRKLLLLKSYLPTLSFRTNLMAGTKTHTFSLDEKTVTIQILQTVAGIQMSQKLMKFALPAYAGIVQAVRGEGDVKSLMADVLENIDELELDKLVSKLMEGATVDGFPVSNLDYFQGNLGDLIDVVYEALTANFKSVFTARALKARLSAMAN